ncbi:hypothetical protein EC915_102613 [Pseudomonas sp. LP_7_YM]|nr:hypothetical protein EC915_102613 [Pseudomonas sp. LP_7_YM]
MFKLKPQCVMWLLVASGLAGCGESSTLQVSDGIGPSPSLPEPNKTLIPTTSLRLWTGLLAANPRQQVARRSPRSQKISITRAGCTCCSMAMCG